MTLTPDTIRAFLATADIEFSDDNGQITITDDSGTLRIYWDTSDYLNLGWAFSGPGGGGCLDEIDEIVGALEDGLGRSYPDLGDSIEIDGDGYAVSGRSNPRLTGPGGEVLHLTPAGRAGLLMAEDAVRFLRRAAGDRKLGVWHD